MVLSGIIFIAVIVLNKKILPVPVNIPVFVYGLPKLNAILNGTCSFLLLLSLYFIRKKNIAMHKRINITAFVLSSLFLISYVTFHYFAKETRYGDIDHNDIVDTAELTAAGNFRMIYFIILISHIVLAAVVLPLVLLSFYRGLKMQVDKHRKLVRWSFPIWLYVTITGVVVYLMISPYYNF